MNKNYKKWLGLILVSLIFIKFSLHSNAATGTVAVDGANIRANANSASTVVASVVQGDELDIIGKVTASDGYVWYQIHVDADTKGYIRSDLVSTTETISTISVTTAETTVTATINTDGVWVRDMPSTSGGLLISLDKGMNVTLIDTDSNWSHVNFVVDTILYDGYIYSDYLDEGDLEYSTETQTETTESEDSESDTSAETESTGSATDAEDTSVASDEYTERTGTVQTDNVRVRSGASTSTDMVASVDAGDTVTVTGEEYDSEEVLWYQVEFTYYGEDITGYIRNDFLSVEELPEAVEEVPVEETVEDTEETVEPVTDELTQEEDGSIQVTAPEEEKSSSKLILIIQILIVIIIVVTLVYLKMTDHLEKGNKESNSKKGYKGRFGLRFLSFFSGLGNLFQRKSSHRTKNIVKNRPNENRKRPADINLRTSQVLKEEKNSLDTEKPLIKTVENKPSADAASFEEEEDLELLFLNGENPEV